MKEGCHVRQGNALPISTADKMSHASVDHAAERAAGTAPAGRMAAAWAAACPHTRRAHHPAPTSVTAAVTRNWLLDTHITAPLDPASRAST